jgi:hypothetical protein
MLDSVSHDMVAQWHFLHGNLSRLPTVEHLSCVRAPFGAGPAIRRTVKMKMLKYLGVPFFVVALAACGGEATPEPEAPEGAAAEEVPAEEMPAEEEAAPAEEEAAPAEEAPAEEAPAEEAPEK